MRLPRSTCERATRTRSTAAAVLLAGAALTGAVAAAPSAFAAPGDATAGQSERAPPAVIGVEGAGDARRAGDAARGTDPGGEAHFFVNELRVEGDNPLPADEVQALLAPYLGEHEGFLGLQGAAESLEELLRARGYAFHRVTIPQQRTGTGSIRFVVRAFRIGGIRIEGAEHSTPEEVRASLPALAEGETPNSRELARALELANQHPSRRLGITVKKSERAGYLDATLKVQDRDPSQFFTNLNNRGSDETGEARLAVGYQRGNLFGLDHAVTLTYTTSPGHWDDVAQYGLNYTAPIYALGGSLSAFYSYSDVDSGTVADFFDVSGKGRFGGVHYVQQLLPYGRYRHRAELSVEDRMFDNNVDFRGRPIGVDVRSRPVGLRYDGEWVLANANFGFFVGAYANLSGGNNNTRDDYTRSRAGAKRDWRSYRYGLNGDYAFPSKWLLRGRFEGQYANEPLVSGEQIGFGGSDSVRGFDERAVAADSGAEASIEVWAPPVMEGLSLLAFGDAGYGRRENAQAGEARTLTLSSAGIGARWRPNAHVALNIDVGVVTNGAGGSSAGDARVHANLLVR